MGDGRWDVGDGRWVMGSGGTPRHSLPDEDASSQMPAPPAGALGIEAASFASGEGNGMRERGSGNGSSGRSQGEEQPASEDTAESPAATDERHKKAKG